MSGFQNFLSYFFSVTTTAKLHARVYVRLYVYVLGMLEYVLEL